MTLPVRIGLISDTHGLLRERALRGLVGSEVIVHAGDIGSAEILDRLRDTAPVIAVRGNVDTQEWARTLPLTNTLEVEGTSLFVLHDLHDLDLDPRAAGFGIVISGHTHKPLQTERAGVLYINPGSAGPRRFNLPITVARLTAGTRPWKVEYIPCDDSPPQRQ